MSALGLFVFTHTIITLIIITTGHSITIIVYRLGALETWLCAYPGLRLHMCSTMCRRKKFVALPYEMKIENRRRHTGTVLYLSWRTLYGFCWIVSLICWTILETPESTGVLPVRMSLQSAVTILFALVDQGAMKRIPCLFWAVSS